MLLAIDVDADGCLVLPARTAQIDHWKEIGAVFSYFHWTDYLDDMRINLRRIGKSIRPGNEDKLRLSLIDAVHRGIGSDVRPVRVVAEHWEIGTGQGESGRLPFAPRISHGIVGVRSCDKYGLPHVQQLQSEPLPVPPRVGYEYDAWIDKRTVRLEPG